MQRIAYIMKHVLFGMQHVACSIHHDVLSDSPQRSLTSGVSFVNQRGKHGGKSGVESMPLQAVGSGQ